MAGLENDKGNAKIKNAMMKYDQGESVLDAERKEKKITMSKQAFDLKFAAYIKRVINGLDGQIDSISGDSSRASEIRKLKKEKYFYEKILWKKDISNIKLDIQKNWETDFIRWLSGTSEKNKDKYTPWGNKKLLHLPGVKEFISKPISLRSNVLKELTTLKMKTPDDLNEAYIYYKYLVNKEGFDEDGLVKDFKEYGYFDIPKNVLERNIETGKEIVIDKNDGTSGIETIKDVEYYKNPDGTFGKVSEYTPVPVWNSANYKESKYWWYKQTKTDVSEWDPSFFAWHLDGLWNKKYVSSLEKRIGREGILNPKMVHGEPSFDVSMDETYGLASPFERVHIEPRESGVESPLDISTMQKDYEQQQKKKEAEELRKQKEAKKQEKLRKQKEAKEAEAKGWGRLREAIDKNELLKKKEEQERAKEIKKMEKEAAENVGMREGDIFDDIDWREPSTDSPTGTYEKDSFIDDSDVSREDVAAEIKKRNEESQETKKIMKEVYTIFVERLNKDREGVNGEELVNSQAFRVLHKDIDSGDYVFPWLIYHASGYTETKNYIVGDDLRKKAKEAMDLYTLTISDDAQLKKQVGNFPYYFTKYRLGANYESNVAPYKNNYIGNDKQQRVEAHSRMWNTINDAFPDEKEVSLRRLLREVLNISTGFVDKEHDLTQSQAVTIDGYKKIVQIEERAVETLNEELKKMTRKPSVTAPPIFIGKKAEAPPPTIKKKIEPMLIEKREEPSKEKPHVIEPKKMTDKEFEALRNNITNEINIKFNKEKKALEKEITTLKKKQAKSEKDLEVKETQLKNLQQKNNTLAQQIKEKNDLLAASNEKRDELEKQSIEGANERIRLRNEKTGYVTEIDKLKKDIKDFNGSEDEKNKLIKESNAKIAEHEAQITEINKSLEDANAKAVKLANEIIEETKNSEKLQQTIDELKEEIKIKESQLVAYEEKAEELQTALAIANAKAEETEAEYQLGITRQQIHDEIANLMDELDRRLIRTGLPPEITDTIRIIMSNFANEMKKDIVRTKQKDINTLEDVQKKFIAHLAKTIRDMDDDFRNYKRPKTALNLAALGGKDLLTDQINELSKRFNNNVLKLESAEATLKKDLEELRTQKTNTETDLKDERAKLSRVIAAVNTFTNEASKHIVGKGMAVEFSNILKNRNKSGDLIRAKQFNVTDETANKIREHLDDMFYTTMNATIATEKQKHTTEINELNTKITNLQEDIIKKETEKTQTYEELDKEYGKQKVLHAISQKMKVTKEIVDIVFSPDIEKWGEEKKKTLSTEKGFALTGAITQYTRVVDDGGSAEEKADAIIQIANMLQPPAEALQAQPKKTTKEKKQETMKKNVEANYQKNYKSAKQQLKTAIMGFNGLASVIEFHNKEARAYKAAVTSSEIANKPVPRTPANYAAAVDIIYNEIKNDLENNREMGTANRLAFFKIAEPQRFIDIALNVLNLK